MKNQIKSLFLVILFAGISNTVWGQASTEGKDFWVANTIVCQPPTANSPAFPTIAVSAQKACTVTITDYAGNQLAQANVAAGSWTRFGENTAAIDPADYYLDPSKWYPTTNNVNATDVYNHADKINNYGLHITATEKISVFIIMRTPQYSMDACNALPITALQSEYYLQDLYPYSKDVSKCVTMTTILATEDNTQVVITPKGNTYGKTNDGAPFTITLNQGQTYYLISSVNEQLAGTHIVAKGGKKIAVYVGSPNTHAPGGVSARDALFEQMMPIDYWGTQFIATRSLQKDGNIIGITATQNGTELKIDGFTQAYINEGETYYIVLQGPSDPYSKNLSKIVSPIDQVITADAAYIETSCPAAVISYDTGNSFAGATGSEIVDGQGDPSSVWLSPIQQKINKITFGACYTKKTQAHFLNVVAETATCTSTTLTAYMGQYGADWSDKLTWTQVPGNPTYSYARVQIGNNTETIKVFTLENDRGFIAHVYGNGEDESYAYSAGSAAVEQGVLVNGETFTNGYRSDKKYCFGDEILFDANVGTDAISRVDWNFGDGTSEYYGQSVTSHSYTSPGWYDVTAALYGHQVCTSESEQYLGSVSFSFRIVRPDTVFGSVIPKCISLDEYKSDPARWDDSIAHPQIKEVHEHCYDTVKLNYIIYNRETEEFRDTIIGHDVAYGYDGTPYYASQDVVEVYKNAAGCDHFVRYYVKVITCLDITVNNNPATQHVCPGEDFSVSYTKTKGDIEGMATLKIPGTPDKEIYISNDNIADAWLTIPVSEMTKPGVYKAQLQIKDENCGDLLKFDIDFQIYYPQDIFSLKYNNVLAVYASGYGGNTYGNFTSFQWYHNGILIPGATSAVYHTDAPFTPGDTYYVELSDGVAVPLPSCPLTIPQDVEDYNVNKAPSAEKKLINRHMYIVIDNRMYDAYGLRVK